MIDKQCVDQLVGRHISMLICDMDRDRWYDTIGQFEKECDILWREGVLLRGALSKDKDYHRWKRKVFIIGR